MSTYVSQYIAPLADAYYSNFENKTNGLKEESICEKITYYVKEIFAFILIEIPYTIARSLDMFTDFWAKSPVRCGKLRRWGCF